KPTRGPERRKLQARARLGPSEALPCPALFSCSAIFSCLKHLDESFLWNIDRAERFHSLFAFLLLFEQLSFPGYVSTITFGGNILAQGAHGLACDDLASDSGLNGDSVLLARNNFFELGSQSAATAFGFLPVNDA